MKSCELSVGLHGANSLIRNSAAIIPEQLEAMTLLPNHE